MKKWWTIGGYAALLVAGVVLLSFVSRERASEVCWRVDLTVDEAGPHRFVTRNMVLNRLVLTGDSLVGTRMDDIHIDHLQRALRNMPHVRRAVVTKTLDGRIEAEVTPRIPVARILNPDGTGFYLDSDRRLMPLSKHYTAHVPLFVTARAFSAADTSALDPRTGRVLEGSPLDQVLTFAQVVEGHALMGPLTEHLYLDSVGHAVVIPRVGGYKIQLGDARNLDAKFDRLQTFLQQTVQSKDLNSYTEINLAYRDQVVCKRRW